jgi:anti-sigma regulatory factor (Ser/Thr protein kinase)
VEIASPIFLEVADPTVVGAVRRSARALATTLGMDTERTEQIALVATELATNLVKHTPPGAWVYLSPLRRLQACGVQIVTADRGPGLDVARAIRDGYSTAGTLGAGLGTVLRTANYFDVFTKAGVGTVQVVQLWDGPGQHMLATDARTGEAGGIVICKSGEEVSGDAWKVSADGRRVLVVDGIGHGPEAARAAVEASRVFDENPGRSISDVVFLQNDALRKTRGAALAIAEIQTGGRHLKYVGVGNIAGSICRPGGRRLLATHNGTVGHGQVKVREYEYEWESNAVLVMHSDGCGTRWSLDDYPGLLGRHPALISAILMRDCRKNHDDSTVVAVREYSPAIQRNLISVNSATGGGV